MLVVESTCIPIDIDNCNTDLIIPARYLSSTTREEEFFAQAFMHDLRYTSQGEPIPDFVLNTPHFSARPTRGVHEVIVVGANWGCGSSREHAAWAIAGYGIRVVIATSIADIHYNNLLNSFVLPVVVSNSFHTELLSTIQADPLTRVRVDLVAQTVTNLQTMRGEQFEINQFKKHCLMNAYDDIDFLLTKKEKIEEYENKRSSTLG